MLDQQVKNSLQSKSNPTSLQEIFIELDEHNEESLMGGIVFAISPTSSSSTTSREYKGITYCNGDPDGMTPHGCY